uniref:Uncharacterized protein n=1 Tax=Anguilla anguilla TaxID=7936 RepID=A0A0E9XW35_ANGAN
MALHWLPYHAQFQHIEGHGWEPSIKMGFQWKPVSLIY